MDKLNDRLKELHSFLEHAHIVENIEETIDHIGGEVNDCMAQSLARAQECTIAIFQATEPPSLLTFLDLSSHRDEDIRKKEIALARARVLSFIASFIEMYHRHGAFSSKYFLEIWNRCRFIARVDYSNRVKAEAYTVIKHLILIYK
jgi:hypothetical protein